MERVCLIVGGNGGVGVSIVKEFLRRGYFVYYTFHSHQLVDEVCNSSFVKGIRVDITSEDDVINMARVISSEAGMLNALIYAAGIFEDSLIHNMELESWNRVMNTNVTGAFLCAKHTTDLLRKSGSGRFIAMGSVMGESGIYGSCSYSASKAALIGLVKSIALENAKFGVTANVISYGYIDAGMTGELSDVVRESAMKKIPMKRLGNPDDGAKIIADLCEPYTNYVSGQVIRNNGLLYV